MIKTIDAKNILKFLLLERACLIGLETLIKEINKKFEFTGLPSFMNFNEFKEILYSTPTNNYNWLVRRILSRKGIELKCYKFAAEFLLSNGMSEKLVNELFDYKDMAWSDSHLPKYFTTLRNRIEKDFNNKSYPIELALMFFEDRFYDGEDFILETILPDTEIFEFFKQKYQITPIN